MEFEDGLMFNFTSIVVTFLLTIVTCFTVFHRLKIRWPVKLNCWFCSNNTKVWRQQRDWWLCPTCEQYNGFSKDGDYNYDIPEQYKASLNNSGKTPNVKSSPAENGLCSKCNQNEELKLQELANFEPSSWTRYDAELDRFKQHLEQKYHLCGNCTNIVQRVLRKQTSWLLEYKMTFFKNKPIQAIVNNGEKWERVFRVILTILDSATIYYSAYWPLPIVGFLLQMGACVTCPANKKKSDLLAAFFWICLTVLAPFDGLKLLKVNFRNEWFAVEHLTQYHVVIALASIIGLMNIKSSPYNMRANTTVSFKKLESPRNKMPPMPSIPNAKNLSPPMEEDKTQSRHINEGCRSPVNITNLLMTPVSVETPMPIKPTIFQRSSPMSKSQHCFSPPPFQDDFMKNSFGFHSPNSFPNRQYDVDKYSLDESLSTLSSLSLSENRHKQVSKSPKVFQTKVYGTSSPDLFSKLNKSPGKKFVLTPPKLKSVTQTSWVAGGYWQAGMDVPSLSRTSSHSSGFGSTGSNFAPSREPSVYNDFDRCSVVSDTTQCCHVTRQNSVNSMNSCYHQGSFSFARPESPVFNQTPKVPQNPVFIQNGTPRMQHFQTSQNFQSFQPQTVVPNNANHVQEAPVQTVHTTVLTSPVWLPALLCGSLVFNMIVLCTTLLR